MTEYLWLPPDCHHRGRAGLGLYVGLKDLPKLNALWCQPSRHLRWHVVHDRTGQHMVTLSPELGTLSAAGWLSQPCSSPDLPHLPGRARLPAASKAYCSAVTRNGWLQSSGWRKAGGNRGGGGEEALNTLRVGLCSREKSEAESNPPLRQSPPAFAGQQASFPMSPLAA